VILDKVVHGMINSQWHITLACIATVFRASEPPGAPAVVAYDATDKESNTVVDGVAFIKSRQLDKRIVIRIVRMAYDERRNTASVAKRRRISRSGGLPECYIVVMREDVLGNSAKRTLPLWRVLVAQVFADRCLFIG
jgi:hypothetical protein